MQGDDLILSGSQGARRGGWSQCASDVADAQMSRGGSLTTRRAVVRVMVTAARDIRCLLWIQPDVAEGKQVAIDDRFQACDGRDSSPELCASVHFRAVRGTFDPISLWPGSCTSLCEEPPCGVRNHVLIDDRG